MHKKPKFLAAFTIVELMVVISAIAVLASIVTVTASTVQKSSRDSARTAQVGIIANALEKYYRDNGEYPSVAAMTSADVNALKQKLGISNPTVFKFPLASESATTSLAASNPSTKTLVYSANTTDTNKNTQCQTDVNGYCDGFTLAYVKEGDGATQTVQSIHATFQAIKTDCDPGDSQSGNTCTHTYTGTYQAGAYTCPSGGSLSGTTCTKTYAASYSPPSSGYYCPSGGSLSGSTCTTSSSYPATANTTYTCPSGGSVVGGANYPLCRRTYSATASTSYSCPHANDSLNFVNGDVFNRNCKHQHSYAVQSNCVNAGYSWEGGACYGYHAVDTTTTYSCPSGGSLSGTTCTQEYDATPTTTYSCPSGGSPSGSTCYTTSTYPATYYSNSGYYYCSGSDSLSGTTCTNTYTGTQGPGYYVCPSGGVASGSTCTYTYQLQS